MASQAAAAASGRASSVTSKHVEVVVRCDAFIALVSEIEYFAVKLNYEPPCFEEEDFVIEEGSVSEAVDDEDDVRTTSAITP